MKQPRRLLADTRDPFEQEVLSAWKRTAPGTAARERAWAEVAPAAGLAAGAIATAAHVGAKAVATAKAAPALTAAAAAPSAALGGAATTWAAASLVKWIVVVSLATGAATTVVVRTSAPQAPLDRGSPALVAPPTHVAPPSVAAAPPTPAVPVPVAAPSARRAGPAASVALSSQEVAPAPVPAGAGASDDHLVARQVASLDEARGALGAGDAARALSLLEDFDARFRGGELSLEAAVLRVKALLAAGRREDAMAAGKRFVDQHPSSPYSTRIRGLLDAK